MKVSLNIQQRLVAFGILTSIKGAKLSDWKMINEAKLILGLSEEDMKYYGIETKEVEGGGSSTTWKLEKSDEQKEYTIPGPALDLIRDDLKKLEEEGKIPPEKFPLAETLLE